MSIFAFIIGRFRTVVDYLPEWHVELSNIRQSGWILNLRIFIQAEIVSYSAFQMKV
jgi:hypothetical protein